MELTNPRKRYTSSNHIDPSADSRRRNRITHRRRNLNPRRERSILPLRLRFIQRHHARVRKPIRTPQLYASGTCAGKANARTRRGIRARSSWGASSTRWSAPSPPPSAAAAASAGEERERRSWWRVAAPLREAEDYIADASSKP